MSDKKFTPKEAALMVLAKAQELYKSSNLAKGDWARIHSKLKREGYSEESADKIDGAIKAKLQKGDFPVITNNQSLSSNQAAGSAAASNPGPSPSPSMGKSDEVSKEAPMKGHIKLAKFIGRMEHKRGQKSQEVDKSETGHEKGVALSAGHAMSGTSTSGALVRNADKTSGGQEEKDSRIGQAKKDSVGRMMEQSKINPKLPG